MRIALLFLCAITAQAQHLIVTAEGHNGTVPPEITSDEVSVEVNRHPAHLDQWVALRGDRADLELYIVIDDGESTELGTQFGELKTFINEQAATTKIGLAYLRNGAANIIAPLTADHSKIAQTLRLPSGQPGIASSPYMGISDLIKKWPAAEARREVLLISSGTDPWSTPDPQNPYLLEAIAHAQRAGVLVHSIYYAGAGHFGHSYWQINWGQSYLSQLGDETGGEAYWQGSGSPVSFEPYLKDLTQRFQNQYLLVLSADKSRSDAEPVRINSSKAGASLTTASKIYLPK